MVVIGFLPDLYSVNEGDGVVIFTVAVISGTLGFDVTLDFSTTSGSALGMYLFSNTIPRLFIVIAAQILRTSLAQIPCWSLDQKRLLFKFLCKY